MSSFTTRRASLTGTIGALLMAGCANLSGLDGTSRYACKAPEGVKCDSVSGTYHNAIQNNLPSQRRSAPGGPSRAPAAAGTAAAGRSAPGMVATAARTAATEEGAVHLATPLRAAPKVLRLWIKPWEDADRDLNGESLVYVQIDNGRWLVDHVQRQVREPYAPVRPTKLPTAAANGTAAEGGKTAAASSPGEEGPSINQALRALQGRSAGSADN